MAGNVAEDNHSGDDPLSRQPSDIDPPSYEITYGSDHNLKWDPPQGSKELAIALSYHFPTESDLESKMQCATKKFLKAEEKKQTAELSSTRRQDAHEPDLRTKKKVGFGLGTKPAKHHHRSSRDVDSGIGSSLASDHASLHTALDAPLTYQQVEEQRQNLSAVQEALNAANEDIRNLEAANARLNRQLSEINKENRLLKRVKEELSNKLDNAKDDLDDKEEIINKLAREGLPTQTSENSSSISIRSSSRDKRRSSTSVAVSASSSRLARAGSHAEEDKMEQGLLSSIKNGSNATALLSDVLARANIRGVTFFVSNYFDLIAIGEFEWIADLRQAGCSNVEIVKYLMESAELDPWSSATVNTSLVSPSIRQDLRVDFHQPQCVHFGEADLPRATGFGDSKIRKESAISGDLNLDDPETIRGTIANLCGLAGIFPPNHNYSAFGYATFSNSTVTVAYGQVSNSSRLPFQDVFKAVLKQIFDSASFIVQALRYLQDSGFCCDRLTILCREKVGAVTMHSIMFTKIKWYIASLQQAYDSFPISKTSGLGVDCLRSCAEIADDIILKHFWSDRANQTMRHDSSHAYGLHSCSLLTQLLGIAILAYSQAHTGQLWPPFLRDPLTKIRLHGYSSLDARKPIAELSYQSLACMSGLVGGQVLVVEITELSPENKTLGVQDRSLYIEDPKEHHDPKVFLGCIEDIVDSWGPAVLISEPNTLYGNAIYSVIIGGGVIALDSLKSNTYHWDRFSEPVRDGNTFSIRETLTIGAINPHSSCPVDTQACRRASESYLHHLGTEADYWRLAERQIMLQGGEYVGVQLGSVYSKVKGRDLKTILLERWQFLPDFRILLQPWGLQMSLCTGVARRVPLKDLFEEPIFSYIDSLSPPDWNHIKGNVRLAFNGGLDFLTWTTGLQGYQRDCLVKVITFVLEILKDTGVNRTVKQLKLLWPHKTSCSYAISLQCSKSNLWARVLRDSPSCATFATVTNVCLEAPGHACKKNRAPIWTGQGALLATAVSRVLVPGSPNGAIDPVYWKLEHGQQCWIEKAGGDVWVYTTKEPNSDAQLTVKVNRFPKGLSIFRNWQVLREKQDATFEAEEVVVFGTLE